MPDLKKDLTILIRTKLDTSERQVNYLQNQLNKMAKSLYLQINNISIAGQAMAQAMTTAGVTTANMSSSTSKGFQQTSQEVKNAGNALQWYHNLLQKVMHQYILQERTADTFVKSFKAVRQMASGAYWNTVDSKTQEVYMKLMVDAEQKVTKAKTEEYNINQKLKDQQTKNRDTDVNALYSDLQNTLKNIYSLKTQMLKADRQTQTELQKELYLQEAVYKAIQRRKVRDNLINPEKEIEYLKKQNELKTKFDISNAKINDKDYTAKVNANYVESNKLLKDTFNTRLKIQKAGEQEKVQLDAILQKDYERLRVLKQERVGNNLVDEEKENALTAESVRLNQNLRVEKARIVDIENQRISNLGVKVTDTDLNFSATREDLEKYVNSIHTGNIEFTSFTDRVLQNGKAVKELEYKVKTGQDKWETYRLTADKTTNSLYNLDKGSRDVISRQVSFGKSIQIAIARTIEWATAMTIFYGSLRQLQKGISYIYEMDTAITNLSKVVDLSKNDLNNMTKEAIRLGKELGKSSVDIAKGMAEFGRIKKNAEEIVELTRVATMASNVTSMSAEDSAKSLTSAMITFGLETKDAMHILDSFNEIQNNFRTSAEDLSDAIGRVGSASKVAKTDMETLEGIITAIVSTTGIAGDEAGTAVKSFISRMYRTDESDLEELGKTADLIKQIVNVDVKGANGLNSFGDVLNEIAKKWGSLTEQEKLALAQQIGGTYHYSKFIGLMNNYQIALDATSKAYNSQNSAIEENQKYMDSLAGHVGLFRNAWEDLMNNVISSDFLKGVVDFGTAFLKVINSFDRFALIISSIGVVLATLSGKLFGILPVLENVAVSIGAIALRAGVSAGAVGALSLALTALIPVAVVGAIYGVIKLVDKLNVSLKEQKQIVQDLTNEIGGLQAKYDELNSKTNLTEEEEKYLSILKEQLNVMKEKLATETKLKVIKEYGNKPAEQPPITVKGVTLQPVTNYDERSNLTYDKQYLPNKNEVDESVANIEKYRAELDKLTGSQDKASDRYQELTKKITEEKVALFNKRQETVNDIKVLKDANQEGSDEYKILTDKLAVIDNVIGQQAILNGIMSKYASVVDGSSRSVSSLNEEYELLDKALEEMNDNGYLSQETIDLLEKNFKGFKEETKLSKDAIIDFILTHKDGVRTLMKNEIAKTDNLIKETKTRIQAMQAELDAMNKLQGKYGEKYDAILKKYKAGLELSKYEENILTYGFGKEKKESINEELQALNVLEQSRNQYSETLASLNKKYESEKSKSTPDLKDAIQAEDITQELIKKYNAEAEISKLKIESLQTQLDINDETKNYNQEIKLSNDLLKEQENRISKLKTANENIHQEAEKVRNTEQNKKYDTTKWFDVNGEATLEYKNLLNSFAKQSEEIRKNTNQNDKKSIEESNKKIKTLEDEKKIVETLFANIYALKKAWTENKQEIDNTDLAIQQLQKDIIDLAEKNKEAQIQAVEDAQNAMINILKAKYEKQKQMEDDMHEMYIDNIDKQIKRLEDKRKAEVYDRNIASIDEDIAKKQAEINALALDNSVEGMAKKAELQEQLNDLLNKKEDERLDHQYESEKDTLENLKDIEDQRHEERIDELDALMDETALFNQTQLDLTKSTVDEIMKKYGEMSTFIGGIYNSLIEKAKLYNQVSLAKDVVNDSGSPYNTTTPQTNTDNIDNILSIVEQIISVKQNMKPENVEESASKINNLRSKLPSTVAEHFGLNKTLAEMIEYRDYIKKNRKIYKNGGLVDYTGLAWVDGTKTRPEGFLNSADLKTLLDALDISKQIVPLVNSIKSPINESLNRQMSMQNYFDLKVYATENQSPLEIAKVAEKFIWDNLSRKLKIEGVI